MNPGWTVLALLIGALASLAGVLVGAELAWRAARKGDSLLHQEDEVGMVRDARPGEMEGEEE